MDVEASRHVVLLFIGKHWLDYRDLLGPLVELVADESAEGMAERTAEALREMQRVAKLIG